MEPSCAASMRKTFDYAAFNWINIRWMKMETDVNSIGWQRCLDQWGRRFADEALCWRCYA